MKNFIIKISVILAMLCITSKSSANIVSFNGAVKELKVNNQKVYFSIGSGLVPNLSCVLAESQFFELDATNPLFEKHFSELLTAKVSDLTLNVAIINQPLTPCYPESISIQ